jgi:hypothetical protein
MNADQALHDAIQERITKENAFFNLLKKAIKDAVDKFNLCDTSTSPEVEDSVNISMDGLTEAIRKLKEETVLNQTAAKGITDLFSDLAQTNHLVQDSNYTTNPNYFAPTATPVPIPSATPIVNGAPAPRSFLDRARGMFGRPNDPAPSNIDRMLGRPDQRWIGNSSYPVRPIYQAEPYDEKRYGPFQAEPYNPSRFTPFGGKRKTRKYRRRV